MSIEMDVQIMKNLKSPKLYFECQEDEYQIL